MSELPNQNPEPPYHSKRKATTSNAYEVRKTWWILSLCALIILGLFTYMFSRVGA